MPIGVMSFPLTQGPGLDIGTALLQAAQARMQRANAEEKEATNPFAGKKALADALHQELINKYYGPNIESEMSYRGAETKKLNQMTPLEVAIKERELKYPGLSQSGVVGDIEMQRFYADHPELLRGIHAALGGNQGQPGVSDQRGGTAPQSGYDPLNTLSKSIEAEIANKRSLADWRAGGGARGLGGVTGQTQTLLMQQLKRDNPNLSDEQVFEAAGNLVNGNKTLSDGTPFNVSGVTALTASKAVLQSVPSAIATQGIKASQAEAEIPIADKYIQEGIAPYGDTIMGRSPQQISDMMNTKDAAAQQRLGKYAASQMLSIEKAALGLKMAGAESGVTIMNEAMDKAQQAIKDNKFLQTAEAREAALNTYRQALQEMLRARKSVGVLESGLTGGQGAKSSSASEPSNGAKILAKDLQLPKFRNAKEFNDWFSRQEKVVQDAVRIKLGSK